MPQNVPMAASRTPYLLNVIRQAYLDLNIISGSEELNGVRMELGLEYLWGVIEDINGDPVMAPAHEKRIFDVSKAIAEPVASEDFYLPWGPDVEPGFGFNSYPPSHILAIRGYYGKYDELGAGEYAAYAKWSVRRFGYFIERTWPEYKLHFPGGIQDTELLTIARYPILLPASFEDALSTEEPFVLNLAPPYNTLVRCRLAKSLAPSLGSGFPVLLNSMLMEVEENIRNRDYHSMVNESDFACVGDDIAEDHNDFFYGTRAQYHRS